MKTLCLGVFVVKRICEAKSYFCGAIKAEGRMLRGRCKKTPMEFAVEANRLMEVSLEGAVG